MGISMTVRLHCDRSIPLLRSCATHCRSQYKGQIPRPRLYKFISDLHFTETMRCISYSSSESVEFSYSWVNLFGDVRFLVPSSIVCIFIASSSFYKPMITLDRMHIFSFNTSESRTGSRYLIPRPRPYEFIYHLHSIESARCISYPSSDSVELCPILG